MPSIPRPFDPSAPATVDLAALRRAVRALETGARGLAGALDLGDPALGRALPNGGIALGALHEAGPQAHFDTPAAYAFLLALAARALSQRAGEIVWVRRRGGCDFGAPYGPGLAGLGLDPRRLMLVGAGTPRDALWAAEEAARTQGLAAVIAEPGGGAGAGLDLAATRRLQLAAEAGGAPVLLWRGGGHSQALGVTAAHTRWRIAAAPSTPPDWLDRLPFSPAIAPPGRPVWRTELTRARGAGSARSFLLEWRHETNGFHLASPLGDGSSAAAGARAVA